MLILYYKYYHKCGPIYTFDFQFKSGLKCLPRRAAKMLNILSHVFVSQEPDEELGKDQCPHVTGCMR